MKITMITLGLMLWLHTAFCQPQQASANTRPFVLGVIEELQSKILGEQRILNIYLPQGYY